jgi:hypothetical protein
MGRPEYYNKTVTIHSKFLIRSNRTLVSEPNLIFGSPSNQLTINISSAKNTSILLDGNTYYFIGKLVNGSFQVYEIKPG